MKRSKYRVYIKYLIALFLVMPNILFGAQYKCNGQNVSNVNGARNDASKSYHTGEDKKKDARYFKFKTRVDGSITIHYQTSKDEDGYAGHRLQIGESCKGFDIYEGTWARDSSKTFNVNSDITYYVRVIENNGEVMVGFDEDRYREIF